MASHLCLPPLIDQEPPAFDIPWGSCDTHAHVVSANSKHFPFVPERSYTPPPAPETAYLQMLKAQGMTRGVLVQISVYGTDNRYMLDVLKRNREKLRGVAVVSPDISDAELVAMHEAGVRGVRINVLFKGGVGFKDMTRIAHRIKDMGWHMQFLMDVRQLPELLPHMEKLPVPGVFDHMGHMPVTEGQSSKGYQALRYMLQEHGWWVKLSGAYRISNNIYTSNDLTSWAQSLVNAAPDQTLWGSDWPHVHIARMVDTGKLRNQLPIWVTDTAVREKILVTNPEKLYGF
ncbi:amidohydrolase [Pusillimonas sp. ANT_WB101]|uniref:amidohydrolase family protein n=1 Tax=Pusillimonas sp. ANT_WB101 TaxID=2597356 RepID=UPI0011EFB3D6|nr:amidohydrolase family protein [Pusillimonas sp. ANT_WB101]KAA0892857.1 amidohydrolase family protein [Pusillimonas sp. ANT_WB101]